MAVPEWLHIGATVRIVSFRPGEIERTGMVIATHDRNNGPLMYAVEVPDEPTFYYLQSELAAPRQPEGGQGC